MGTLGQVRIGHKAPDFHCEAVVKGAIEEVSLAQYISHTKTQWLILLFIPAAFSFVCPTEVLAFQNCLDEFHDRNCDVLFVSVDTKHSLWHWQNVPRQYGGLGQIDIALLSDASHKMSRDYGVLIEEEGVSLRGMFIIDDKAIVQQITLNNLSVGRSVLEALRLLEAFQAVAKHGVLCPIDWRPSTNAQETLTAISNTLIESYDERLANLQHDFGDTLVTDLDAKHKKEDDELKTPTESTRGDSNASSRAHSAAASISSLNADAKDAISDRDSDSGSQYKSHGRARSTRSASNTDLGLEKVSGPPRSYSAPASASVTPMPTASSNQPPPLNKRSSFGGTARHSRAHHQSSASTLPRSQSSQKGIKHNTYESRRGSHIVLGFADPTTQSHGSQPATSNPAQPDYATTTSATSPHASNPTLYRPMSLMEYSNGRVGSPKPSPAAGAGNGNGNGNGNQTRLQMTFEAIKNMSSGLATPKGEPRTAGEGKAEDGRKGEAKDRSGDRWGYFDVVPEGVEA